jgi:hypothetical protein
MTRQEIIELALQLTERKAEKQLKSPALFSFVCQDIAKRSRFWWRNLTVPFSLVANTNTYDLTNLTTFPGMKELAFDEITKISVILQPNPLKTAELIPIFDPEGIIEMTLNTTQVAPSRYTMQGDHVILIDPPDLNYSAYINGWAMPNPASDSTSDAVPLIPTWGHNAVVAGLAWKYFKFQYGSKNPKSEDALAEYEQAIEDLLSKKKFDPNYRSQLSLAEDAVRST